MTIREIETRSGMTRANVRFYEAEGLLQPQRLENGYRNYSEEDLTALMRIRLLRALGVPIEELRALQNGDRTLSELMRLRLDAMRGDAAALERTQTVCRAICEDGASYEALDAARYLDALETLPAAAAGDVLLHEPWRRFFARLFDWALCGMIWDAVLMLAFRVNLRHLSVGMAALSVVIQTALTLLFEPVFLSRPGTTPGKWLLGLRVTDSRGVRLTYDCAMRRTLRVLWYGLGLNIPLYRLFRLYRSYRMLAADEPLPWEDGLSRCVLRDRRPRRVAAFAATVLLLGVIGAFALLWADLPPHRGALTVAELCDNYNRMAAWYDLDGNGVQTLDTEGRWIDKELPPGSVILDLWDLQGASRPELQFTVDDGAVKAVGFTLTVDLARLTGPSGEPSAEDGPEGITYFSLPYIEALLTLSYCGAQEDAGLTMQQARNAANHILNHRGEDVLLTANGLVIRSETETAGTIRIVTFSIG